jgi:hypothetical protein
MGAAPVDRIKIDKSLVAHKDWSALGAVVG